MEKIKDLVKKYDTIIMIIITGIISLSFAFTIKLNANDTLWNFSNIYKMSNGYVIYNNLNVIITPLFFYIGKIIFQIFPRNYLTYNIYQNVIIYMMLFSMCYILMKKIGIKKLNAMLFTTIISIMTISIMPEGSYNMLAIFFVTLGTYNLIANIGANKKKHIANIVQGIICFLVFTSKQNIGVLFIVAMSIAQFITIKNKKEVMINLIEQGITVVVFLLGLIGFMYYKGNLEGFINYAFLGIGEFSNQNFRFQADSLIYVVIAVVFNIIFFTITFIKIPFKENDKKIIRILSVISIFMIIIAYPLINTAHALIGTIIFMILASYMMELLVFRDMITGKKVELIKKLTLGITMIVMIIICMINNISFIIKINKDSYYFNKESIYYGAIAEKQTAENIDEICKYITEENKNGYDVKIVSSYSDLYMNVLKRNNGVFDLPFYGNLGKQGIEGLKKQINELEKTRILIAEEKDYRHLQESDEIKEYIQNNFEKVGEIEQFAIYNSKK